MNVLFHVGHTFFSQVLSVFGAHAGSCLSVSELSPLYTLLIRNKQTDSGPNFIAVK